MATHTLVSLTLYLLPYERSHAQAYLQALGRYLGVAFNLSGVDRHRDAAGNWVVGMRELLVDPRQRVLSYHYDDSVAIVHVAAPDHIADGGDFAATWKATVQRQDQWRGLVSESLPPYHCAFAHVLEDYRGGRDRACDDRPSALVGDGSPAERLRVLPWCEHELLVFARSDSELLVDWCFNDAHLVRLLLFHGKAAVYRTRAPIFAEIAEAAASTTPLSRPQLATGHRAAENVTTAVENFAREQSAAGLDGTPLAKWFENLHAVWKAEATAASKRLSAVAPP